VVQEWVRGSSLEDCLRYRWPTAHPEGGLIRSLIEQLFAGIVIPLWHAGTIWWDIRDANFCYCRERGLLRMIDIDSLGAYSREILNRSGRWDAREKGRLTALARLRRMCVRLLCAQQMGSISRIEKTLQHAWSSILEPELRQLGRKADSDQVARAALERFIAVLEQVGLFSQGQRR
jgi:hypothetical protein